MARPDGRHVGSRPEPTTGRRRLLPWLAGVTALVVLAGGAVAYRLDAGDWLTGDRQGAPSGTAQQAALVLPGLAAPSPVASALPSGSGSAALDPAQVSRVLAPGLTDPDLGPSMHAMVAPLSGGPAVFSAGGGVAVPASTTKLLTMTAALAALGPQRAFRTSVVMASTTSDASSTGSTDSTGSTGSTGSVTSPPRIVLVGGGDPLLGSEPDPTAYPARADVATLARATAAALLGQGIRRVTLAYDDSLFSGPPSSPHWPDSYLTAGVVAPIGALWVDEGRPARGTGRVADPAAYAAEVFAAALAGRGVRVVGTPAAGTAGTGDVEVAGVDGPPVAALVEHVLEFSDNEAAEVLGHQIGVTTSGIGSFNAGATGVLSTLAGLGIPTDGALLYDGSGLSRDDRLAPATLLAVLQAAASEDRPELRPVLTGLPVAGFSGSLTDRFAEVGPRARSGVRAKTGTLTGVSALAGVATDLDGDLMAFVLMADEVALPDTLAAREALDRLAAALATCRCAA